MSDTLNRVLESQVKQLSDNYKLTPATLAHRLNPRWVPSPHLLYISARIAAALRRGNARLLISMPPRHGKSELITKYASIWALEMFPAWNIILSTYGADLSQDFGREIRDIIQANESLLNVRISPDATRAARWKTPQNGGMAAVGVGGAITGRGANLFLIDDYIKGIQEALSPSYKDGIWDWFKTVAMTRLEPDSSMVIVATRWAPDDLQGRILDQLSHLGWEYIRIPAICDSEDDPLHRPIGAALFPERYPLKFLQDQKDTLGSFFFNALYQQTPEYDENKLSDFRWLKYVDIPPILNGPNIKLGRIWDLAATEGGGDYTAGTHMAIDRNTDACYLLNVIRRRMSPQSIETLVRQTALADGVETTIFIEQEPGSSGKALVEHYQNNVLPEFRVVAVPSNDGKLSRAQPLLAAAEAGKVYLVRGQWNKDFVKEFGDFPNGDYDDQVDTAAIGYVKLSGKRTFSVSWGRHLTTSKDTNRPDSYEPNSIRVGDDMPQVYRNTDIPRPKAGVVFGRNRNGIRMPTGKIGG